MRQFRTPIKELIDSSFKIDTHSQLYFLGSCFSDRMSQLLLEAKFQLKANPSGILFDPISLCRYLDYHLTPDRLTQDAFVEREGTYFSYEHHSQMHASSAGALLDLLKEAHLEAATFLRQTDVLLLTLGTAIVRILKANQQVVANCHKQAQSLFDTQLLEVSVMQKVMIATIQRLRQYNKNIQILLTVSPVRHTKEGLVQNQLSKSSLRVLAAALTKQFDFVSYYPSYEIMIDDLRDYRFYAADMIHPSKMAISYIFDHFVDNYFSVEAQNWLQKMQKLKNRLTHHLQHPNMRSAQIFIQQTEELLYQLMGENPRTEWRWEQNKLEALKKQGENY